MRTIEIEYNRNPHQKDFDDDLATKFLHLSCGFGGGKSYGLVHKALKLSYVNRDIAGGIVCQSISDYKKDVLPLMEQILEENRIPHKYHQTDKWWRFPWSRAKVQVVSAEKTIKGPNWGWACINEVSLISHQRYKEVIGRVRVKGAPHPQIASSGTPEGIDHWLYENFVETPMQRSRVIFGDTRNNQENLGEDYIQSLEQSYDSIMLDAYLRGLFVNMRSARFYYAYDPAKHDDPSIERLVGEDVYVSLDFNVSPMCATLWHYVPFRNRAGSMIFGFDGKAVMQAIAFDQIEIPDGADTHKMCDAFFAYGLKPDSTVIFPDPAGKARSTKGPLSDIEIIKSRGFNRVHVRLVAPDFRKRQLATNNVLDKQLVRIHPQRAKGLKKDFIAVERDPGTGEKLKSNPKLTHYSDGFDYMVDHLFPLSGTKPDSKSVRCR